MPLPRTLLLLYVVVVATYSNEGFINIVLPPYLQHQGIALAQLGGIVAAMHVAAIFSRIPAGLLYRPERASLSIALAGATVAAATFAYPRTDAEVLLGVLRLVHGFAFGILTTLNMAQFFDVRPRGVEPGRAMGFFAAAIGAGFVIGGFLGGWWADTFGYESAFSTAALFPLLAAVINLQIRGAPAARGRGDRGQGTGNQARGARSPAPHLSTSLGALRNPGILMAALLLFCTNLLNQAFTPYFTLYALDVGHSLTVIGFIGGMGGFAGLWVRVIAGELGRWWSYQAICRGAITVSAIAAALVPTTTWLWALAALLTVVYVLRSVLTVTGGASVIGATDTTAEQRGLASGIFNMGKDLGSILGPILGGLVAGQVGVGPMLPVMAVATLALFWGGTALLAARLRRGRAAHALTP